jgi:hypothetical protein
VLNTTEDIRTEDLCASLTNCLSTPQIAWDFHVPDNALIQEDKDVSVRHLVLLVSSSEVALKCHCSPKKKILSWEIHHGTANPEPKEIKQGSEDPAANRHPR